MLNKRIYEYSQSIIEDALQDFVTAQTKGKFFDVDALKAGIVKDEKGDTKPFIIEAVSRIEDFANIIYRDGFDVNTQRKVNISDLSEMMEDFAGTQVELANGGSKKLGKDMSLSTLGFVVSQTITRLVSKMEYHDLDAWMLVSRDMIMEDGAVYYNVVVGNRGEAATTRVAEGGEFNTFHLESTEDYIKTSGGKVGVMVAYSEEASRRCGIQAIKMLTEAAIIDMKRFKTIEAIRILESNARTFFDGLDAKKMPSGTSLQNPKVKNGAILYRDLETVMCETQAMGFNIDTIFIHPLALKVFYREPAIKEYLERTANIRYFVPKKRQTIMHNLLTKLSKKVSGTQQAAEGEEFAVPQLLANKQLNVVVTPIVRYHKIEEDILEPTSRYGKLPVVQYKYDPQKPRLYPCTDILFIDSSRALTHSHDGRGIMSDKIEDRLHDVTQIKFRAYYNFLLDKDHGIFAFRNISVTDDVFNRYINPQVVINHADLWEQTPEKP